MVKRANHPWRRFYAGRSDAGGAGVATSGARGKIEGRRIAIESGLQYYLRCINEAPLLDAATERDLGGKVRAQYDAGNRLADQEIDMAGYEQILTDAQDARTQMVRSNLRLVVNIAKQFSNRGLPLSDLIEEGNLGLMRAVEGYDPVHETRFSTYASWWIKQAIKRSLINSVQSIHIPAYMVEEISRWKQAAAALEDKLGRPATLEEMCTQLEMKPRKARIIRKAIRAITNPTRATEQDEGLTLSEMIADDKTPRPDELLVSQTDAESVRDMLGRLNAREATILKLRFGLDGPQSASLDDIAGAAELEIDELCQQIRGLVDEAGDTTLLAAVSQAFDAKHPAPVDMDDLAGSLEQDVGFLQQRIQSLYDSLDGQERLWLGMRFGLAQAEGMTLKEIGKKIGLTRERVRQIEHEALDKMNKMLNGDDGR